MSSSNITKCPAGLNDLNGLISSSYDSTDITNDIHGLGLVGYTQTYSKVQYKNFNVVSDQCENKDPDNPCSVEEGTPKCKDGSYDTGIYSLFSGTLTTYFPPYQPAKYDYDYSCNVTSVESANNPIVCKSIGGDDDDPQYPKFACFPYNNTIVDPSWDNDGSKQLKNVWCGENPNLDNNKCEVFTGNPLGLQLCKDGYHVKDSKYDIYQALKTFINENYESSNNKYNYFDVNSVNFYKDNIISTNQNALVLPKLVHKDNEYYLYFPMLISNMNIPVTDKDINSKYLELMKMYITNFLGDPNITTKNIFEYLEPYENSNTDFCCCYSQNCDSKPNSQNDTLDCSQDCESKEYICVEWMEMPRTYSPGKALIKEYENVSITNGKELQYITKKIMEENLKDLNTIEYITTIITNNKTLSFSLWGGDSATKTTRDSNTTLYVPKFAKDYINSLQPKYSDYTFEYIPVGSEYGPSLSDKSELLTDKLKISTVNDAERMAMKYNLTIYDKYDNNTNNKLSRTQFVDDKEYFYGAVGSASSAGKGTNVGKQYNVNDNVQKTPNFLLGNSPYYIFMDDKKNIYNDDCNETTMNSIIPTNSINKKIYTAGQLRQNFNVIGKWYKFRVKKWSPTLYIMAAKIQKVPFDETFLEKVKSDTQMMPMQLFYNQCTINNNNNNWKANGCTEITEKSCTGINYGIDETSYKLPGINYIFDDYFLVSTSSNDESGGVCLCLASNLRPVFNHTKFIDNDFTKAAYCFSSSCDNSQLPESKLTDETCKSYCDIVYDWLTNPDPGKRSRLPQELNSSKFTNLCGSYKPPGSSSYNKIILFVGIILISVTLIVLLRIFRNKSTRFKLELDITTGVILVALLAFLVLDLNGVSSCNGNNIECRSKITNIKIPKFLCPVLQGCECKDGISATCPNPNQQCIQGVCSDINYPNIKDGQIVLRIGENFVKNKSYQTPDGKYTLEYGETFGIYYGDKQTTDKKYKWSINKYSNVMFKPNSSSFENSILKINCDITKITPKLFELSSKEVTPNLINKTCIENNPDYTNFIPANPQDVQDAMDKYNYEIDIPEADAWWDGDCATAKNGKKSCFDMFTPPVKQCKCGSYSNGVYSDCGFEDTTGGNMEYDVWCTYDCTTKSDDCNNAKYYRYSMPDWNEYNGQYGYAQKNKDKTLDLKIAQNPTTNYEQNVMCYNNSPIYEGNDKKYIWNLNEEIDSSRKNILNTFLVFTNDGHLAGYSLDGKKVWTTGPNNSIISV